MDLAVNVQEVYQLKKLCFSLLKSVILSGVRLDKSSDPFAQAPDVHKYPLSAKTKRQLGASWSCCISGRLSFPKARHPDLMAFVNVFQRFFGLGVGLTWRT